MYFVKNTFFFLLSIYIFATAFNFFSHNLDKYVGDVLGILMIYSMLRVPCLDIIIQS